MPDIADQLKAGVELNGTTYKVHLDGHNQLPCLLGEAEKSPRNFFFYVSDDGDLTAVRYDNWKLVFLEQRAPGTLRDLGGAVHAAARAQDLQPAHRPLRAGRHHVEHLLRLDARSRLDWCTDAGVRARDDREPGRVPPRQKPASFSLDQVLEKLQTGLPSA